MPREFVREADGVTTTQFVGGFLMAMRDHRQQSIPGDPFAPETSREQR